MDCNSDRKPTVSWMTDEYMYWVGHWVMKWSRMGKSI